MKPRLTPSLTILSSLFLTLIYPITTRAAALEFTITQAPGPSTTTHTTPKPAKSVVLNFTPQNTFIPINSQPKTTPENHTLNTLFTGDSISLVAKAVGSAEGTRTPTGGYTAAYYGHIDPGNGVWNLGSFSYQHGATSPEQADHKQLKRLQLQAMELRHQAQSNAFSLSLLEELNGIDLANQAPLAALDRGYITWLHIAKQRPMTTAERIVWARTKAFLDPDTGYWDAPGLGNHWDAIYRDQLRRYDAIEQALGEHQP